MKTEIISYAEFTKRTGIKITQKHTGKMIGMQSLSTSCLLNKYCQERAKVAGSICSHCYAQRMMKQYGEKFQGCFEKNTIGLKELIDVKYLQEKSKNEVCIMDKESLDCRRGLK